MQRVVKRYLMHNQGDSDDPKQNDFEDIRQDLQQAKFEIVNDLKKTREESLRNAFTINNGIQYIAEELLMISPEKKIEDNSGSNQTEQNKAKASTSERSTSLHKLKDFINSNKLFFKTISALSSKDRVNHRQNRSNFGNSESNLQFGENARSISSDNSGDLGSKSTLVKTPTIEEFYQNRLAYDFQTLYENDL